MKSGVMKEARHPASPRARASRREASHCVLRAGVAIAVMRPSFGELGRRPSSGTRSRAPTARRSRAEGSSAPPHRLRSRPSCSAWPSSCSPRSAGCFPLDDDRVPLRCMSSRAARSGRSMRNGCARASHEEARRARLRVAGLPVSHSVWQRRRYRRVARFPALHASSFIVSNAFASSDSAVFAR